jgi:hypothetical protein
VQNIDFQFKRIFATTAPRTGKRWDIALSPPPGSAIPTEALSSAGFKQILRAAPFQCERPVRALGRYLHRSSTEKALQSFQISGRPIVIFLGFREVAVFGSVLGAGKINLHTFLVLGHIAAQSITRRRLLLLETIQPTVH